MNQNQKICEEGPDGGDPGGPGSLQREKLLFTLCLLHMQEHTENTGCQGGTGPQDVL